MDRDATAAFGMIGGYGFGDRELEELMGIECLGWSVDHRTLEDKGIRAW